MMKRERTVAVLIPYRKEGDGYKVFVQKRTVDAPILPDYFGLFGGAVEEGETPEDTVVRETYEELTIHITNHSFFREYYFAGVGKFHVFSMEVGEDFEDIITIREGQYGKFLGTSQLRQEKVAPWDLEIFLDFLQNLQPVKLLTLCLITDNEKILLGKAKRGKGMGKWNGFGGKVEAGENIEDAARREVLEEASITVSDIEKVGVIDFVLPGEEQIWQVHIFSSTSFTGEPTESEEMEPKWFPLSDIPYASMWPDDQYWFPLFLAGKKFTGRFVFNEAEEIVEQQLHEAETL